MALETSSDNSSPVAPSKNNKMTLSFDLRLVVALLLVVIGLMLFMWQPWAITDPDAKSRTITVSGEATITAVPDEYVFNPSYEFKNTDKKAALAAVSSKSDEIIKKLKDLGVADNKIKSDASGYNYSYYYDESSKQNTYSLYLTITVNNKELSQKVQDYLLTTAPMGNVSPQAGFSHALQKKLESDARDEAAKDARAKADRTAKNLGFTVGKVKSIADSSNNRGPIYYGDLNSGLSTDSAAKESSLQVQPGENDLPYTITVIYYVKD